MSTTQLVVTFVGPDRPGLVNHLSQAIAAGGGNWLDARMVQLAGQFAGIVQVAVASAQADALTAALRALGGDALSLQVVQGQAHAPRSAARMLRLEVLGQDRPGIVRDISRTLAGREVNIAALDTEHMIGSFSGEAMFKARILLHLPPGLEPSDVRAALEALATELMVDFG
ncbi:MAG: ACT domain-containing protein [Proteobacteria bacterium]|nr:ACT domain-containing protein [Pseudomonadota bacterium]